MVKYWKVRFQNPWMKWITMFSDPIGIDCRRGITRYAQKHYAESIADLKAALAQAREPWHIMAP